MLELADRADSNSAVREDVWVQVPLAAPGFDGLGIGCRASPPDPSLCVDEGGLGRFYPYLLGLYLGDGMLTLAARNVWRLRISLDTKYPCIIARAKAAIAEVGARTAGETARPGCVELHTNWKHWRCLFPQHGPGPKHLRQIRLEPWQTSLVSRYPDEFLAGLIHSDGCRCVNRAKGHQYPRYFFSNLSVDIRALFASTCALVAVECRPAGRRNVSVARRGSVEILDRLVGPKS
jgi:hypothetical protein